MPAVRDWLVAGGRPSGRTLKPGNQHNRWEQQAHEIQRRGATNPTRSTAARSSNDHVRLPQAQKRSAKRPWGRQSNDWVHLSNIDGAPKDNAEDEGMSRYGGEESWSEDGQARHWEEPPTACPRLPRSQSALQTATPQLMRQASVGVIANGQQQTEKAL